MIREIIKKSKFIARVAQKVIQLPFEVHFILNKPIRYKLIDGQVVKFYPKGQISRGIYFQYFEKEQLILFQKNLKSDMIFLDIGANIGLYSIISARLMQKGTGRVFSIEPSKENFNRLLANVNLNKFQNIIFCSNIGFGEKEEIVQLLQENHGGDAERFILNNYSIINGKSYEKLETIELDTMDNFCIENKIAKVDFIKIDTEGFEYFILKGGEAILKTNPEAIILFECTPGGAKRFGKNQEDVFYILRNLGWSINYYDYNIKKFIPIKENFINNNFDFWACKSCKVLNENLSNLN